jgi:hypothetical protein
VWIVFVGNCTYTPRGLSPAWRPRLEDGLLDVQYLRADLRFGRTRAVLATLLGVSEHARTCPHPPRGSSPEAEEAAPHYGPEQGNRGKEVTMLVRRIARPLLAASFINDGVDGLRHPQAHVAGAAPLVEKVAGAADKQLPVQVSCTASACSAGC